MTVFIKEEKMCGVKIQANIFTCVLAVFTTHRHGF